MTAPKVNPPVVARRPRLVLQAVGLISIAFSMVGLWLHAGSLTADQSCRAQFPYFFQVYYKMAAINIGLLVGGVVVGIALVRCVTMWVFFFVGLQVAIVLDFWEIGSLWLDPTLGRTIASATGISSGTVLHIITLFPFWGSIAALWAYQRIEGRRKNVLGA